MLRAVRLAAKLGCTIEKKTAEPIPRLAELIGNVPVARLFDEMQKLLLSGHATETLRSLRAHGLHHGLLPMIDVVLEQPGGQRFIEDRARADRRAACARTAACPPRSSSPRCSGTRCSGQWSAAKDKGERSAARAVRRDGRRALAAGGAHRHPAPVRGDDQGDLVAAAALRAARRAAPVPACSSTRASAWRTTSSCCAREAGEMPRALGRLVDALPGGRRGRARGDAAPDEAPPRSGAARAAAGASTATTTRCPSCRPAARPATRRPELVERRARATLALTAPRGSHRFLPWRWPSSGWAATSPIRAGASRARWAISRGCRARVSSQCPRATSRPRSAARSRNRTT